MKRRFLMTGFLIAALALGGCSNLGSKTSDKNKSAQTQSSNQESSCLLYTSDAADEQYIV